jgi:hypothetical protein
MGPFALVDAEGRPFAMPSEYAPGSAAQFLAEIRAARAIREARDAAFARAREPGADRAAALQAGLRTMGRWLVVRCYSAELEETAATAGAGVRAWAAPLFAESQILRGFDAIGRASHGQLDEIDPRRLRALLAAATEAWQDVPDVLQLAACCQATADLRLALDAADHAAIAERLEATIGAAPHSLGATYAALMLRTLGR